MNIGKEVDGERDGYRETDRGMERDIVSGLEKGTENQRGVVGR
jgi:hypothetical protein